MIKKQESKEMKMLENNMNKGIDQIEQLENENEQIKKDIKNTELLISTKEVDLMHQQDAMKLD